VRQGFLKPSQKPEHTLARVTLGGPEATASGCRRHKRFTQIESGRHQFPLYSAVLRVLTSCRFATRTKYRPGHPSDHPASSALCHQRLILLQFWKDLPTLTSQLRLTETLPSSYRDWCEMEKTNYNSYQFRPWLGRARSFTLSSRSPYTEKRIRVRSVRNSVTRKPSCRTGCVKGTGHGLLLDSGWPAFHRARIVRGGEMTRSLIKLVKALPISLYAESGHSAFANAQGGHSTEGTGGK
jgi:hypothetical protein